MWATRRLYRPPQPFWLYRPPQSFWRLLPGSIAKRLTSSPKMPLHLFVWAITPLTVWYLEGAIYIQETASAEWALTIKACIPPGEGPGSTQRHTRTRGLIAIGPLIGPPTRKALWGSSWDLAVSDTNREGEGRQGKASSRVQLSIDRGKLSQ